MSDWTSYEMKLSDEQKQSWKEVFEQAKKDIGRGEPYQLLYDNEDQSLFFKVRLS
jgi:hypothetical protein